MVLVRRKRMERRGNNTGGASLPPHCQGRFLRLTVITHSADDMEEVHQFTLQHAQTSACIYDPASVFGAVSGEKNSLKSDFLSPKVARSFLSDMREKCFMKGGE